MPYKVEGNKVMHEKNGKWSVKQTCKNHEAAMSAMRLLQGIDHGWKPDKQKSGKEMIAEGLREQNRK